MTSSNGPLFWCVFFVGFFGWQALHPSTAQAETPPAEYDDLLPFPSLLTLSPCKEIPLPPAAARNPIRSLVWSDDFGALGLLSDAGEFTWISATSPHGVLVQPLPKVRPKIPPKPPAATPPKPTQNVDYAQSVALALAQDGAAALSLYAWYTETTDLIVWNPTSGEVTKRHTLRDAYTHIAWLAPDGSVALLSRSFGDYSAIMFALVDLRTGKQRTRTLVLDDAMPDDSLLIPPPPVALSADRKRLWTVRRDADLPAALTLCHMP